MAHKIKEIIKDPYKLWGIIVRRVPIVGHSLSDEEYISVVYREMIGKKLDLQNPQTFNEKIQWLKIHDRKPQYTMMVDKYEVKKYVSGIIGSQYIIPTIGVWERFDDIDFGVLPNQFVIK